MSIIIEGPIRTSTPLSEAGASAGGESSSELASLQQQQQQQQSSDTNNTMISKAAHDAIFGHNHQSTSSTNGASRSPIVAHEDDSLGYYVPQQQLRQYESSGNYHPTEIIGRSSRLMMTAQQVPLPPPTSVAPTALMIMRRRRSDSLGDGNSGSNSNNSGSGSSGKQRQKQQLRSPKSIPESSPSSSELNDELLNHQAATGASVVENSNPTQHPPLQHTRYNSSLGAYPSTAVNNPPAVQVQQLHHPSVAAELIADHAKYEADYYGYPSNNIHNTTTASMDYGYDYGGMDIGGYYGATPSFRGMSMPQGGGAMMDRHLSLNVDHQFYQTMNPRSQLPPQQQQQQVSFQGVAEKADMPPTQTHSMPNTQGGKVYQERDYKNDRVWQEDDHTSRPERRSSTERSVGSRKNDLQDGAPPLSAGENQGVSSMHRVEQGQLLQGQAGQQMMNQPSNNIQQVHQGRAGLRLSIDDHDIQSHPPGMSPYYHHRQSASPPPSSTTIHPDPRVRQNSDMSSVAGSVSGSVGGMMPIYYGAAPPMVHPDPRMRQNSMNSDMSSVAGSVSGSVGGHAPMMPMYYGGPAPLIHPHYGLIYPPTPGSIGSTPPSHHQPPPMAMGVFPHSHHQLDPRGMWVDPHLQQQMQVPVTMPHSSNAIVKPAQEKAMEDKPRTRSSMKTASRTPPPPPSSSAPPNLPPSIKPDENKHKRAVSFTHLHIRTYETILGDNPSCSGGPSLGIGWRYDPSHYIATVDEYEAAQALMYGIPGQTYACRPEDLVLHRFEREAILLNTGYTRQDLAESVRSMNKVKNKRRQTVHNLPAAFVEERVEVVKRTLRRWMLKKERTRYMYEDWKRRSAEGRQYSS